VLGDPRLAEHAEDAQSARQVSREFSAVLRRRVLREDVADWFELDADSPYMLLVADLKPERRRRMTNEEEQLFGIDKLKRRARSEIPAVTHVDYSARIQDCARGHQSALPRADLALQGQDRLPGPGQHQLQCALGADRPARPRTPSAASWATRSSCWSSGNCMLRKQEQDPALKIDYKDEFEAGLSRPSLRRHVPRPLHLVSASSSCGRPVACLDAAYR